MLKFNLIAAACETGGIGYQNQLPWSKDLPNEWKHFDTVTRKVQYPNKKNVVIFGRLTWESLEPECRPLKERLNIVISGSLRQENTLLGVFICRDWNSVLAQLHVLSEQNSIEKIWVAGGQNVYQMAIDTLIIDQIYLTRIHKHYKCDTFFPKIDEHRFIMNEDPLVSKEEQTENGISYHFKIFKSK